MASNAAEMGCKCVPTERDVDRVMKLKLSIYRREIGEDFGTGFPYYTES